MVEIKYLIPILYYLRTISNLYKPISGSITGLGAYQHYLYAHYSDTAHKNKISVVAVFGRPSLAGSGQFVGLVRRERAGAFDLRRSRLQTVRIEEEP